MSIGIDPGLHGALAYVGKDGLGIKLWGMPLKDSTLDLRAIWLILQSHSNTPAYLEGVHAFPGQGVSSSFKFGQVFGMVEGLLAASNAPYSIVTPQAWQKILGDGAHPKERVRQFCEVQWGLDVFIPPRGRVPHQGMMDAACIAEYGRRLSLGLIEPPRVRTKPKKRAALKL
jgi:crossover junction endodeoxyribonuclease RuvC